MVVTEVHTGGTVASDRTSMRAYDRARRSIGAAVGVGGVLWVVAHLPMVLRQAHIASPWWTSVTVVALVAASGALAGAGLRGGVVAVRRTAVALAATFPLCVGALPLACRYACFVPEGTWLPPLVAVTTVAGVLAWPRAWPVYLLAAGTLGVAVDLYVSGGPGVHSLAQSLLRTYLAQGFFAVIAARVLHAAGRLDEATGIAVRQATVAATIEATDQEQARFAGLIHDSVLATLLETARAAGGPGAARAAARTLRQLAEIGDDHAADRPMTIPAALAALSKAVTEVDASIAVRARIARDADTLGLPREVVTAMAAALGEAARNSVRHAAPDGRAVSRRVAVVVDEGGASVRFTDDGVGFDPARVALDRLGVRHSILGRMRRLRGGDAVVETRPGRGTAITLRWTHADPSEPALPALINAHSPAGAALLVLLLLAILLWLLGELDYGADPVLTAAAYGLTALTGVAVLVPRADPLSWPVTWLAVAVGPIAAALTIAGYAGTTPLYHVFWIAVAYSYSLAVIAIRSRIGPAAVGLAGVAVTVLAAGGGIGGMLDALASPAETVVAAGVLTASLRPTLRSFHAARAVVAAHAGAEARAAALSRERERQLAYLDHTARPVLERIAAGRPLSAAAVEECRLLEAQLRDRLRAPGFAVPEFVRAARRARRRGIDVTVFDDGGLGEVTDRVRALVIETAVGELDATRAGRVTVRALPPGRDTVATVVVSAPDRYRRIEIDPAGAVARTSEIIPAQQDSERSEPAR